MPARMLGLMMFNRNLHQTLHAVSQHWEVRILELARTNDAFPYTLQGHASDENFNIFDVVLVEIEKQCLPIQEGVAGELLWWDQAGGVDEKRRNSVYP